MRKFPILLTAAALDGGKTVADKVASAAETVKTVVAEVRGFKNGVKVKVLAPMAEENERGEVQRYAKGAVALVNPARLKALAGLVEKITLVTLLALLALAFTPTAHAQQYGVLKELLSIGGTNVAGATTNIGNIGGANTNYLTLTKWDSFDLQVTVGLTNASAGTLDLNWSTSADGLNWANTGAGQGWFSVPLTNGSTVVTWRTNITSPFGYYKLGIATNAAVQHTTNVIIRAYKKPRDNG